MEFEVFEPKTEKEIPAGTVSRAKAKCLVCNAVLLPERVRAQLTAQHGGADVIFDAEGNRSGGALLLVAVMHKPGEQGRRYLTASREDYEAVYRASKRLAELASRPFVDDLAPVPTEPLGRVPVRFGVINVWVYGIEQWASLFSARQQLALSTIGRIVRQGEWGRLYGLLALSLDKVIDFNSSIAKWAPGRETSAATFGRPALPMMWDYCETVPISSSTGSIEGAIGYAANVAQSIAVVCAQPAHSSREDARHLSLPDQSADVWFTDPPYYDNVPYSYISDFFYVWLKRVLRAHYPQLLNGELTPKPDEIVAYTENDDQGSDANRRFVLKLTTAFTDGRRILREDSVGCVVFAHQSTEGWEALLSGLIQGGWVITASWPIATERAVRPRAYESAALNTSVHLVCRARNGDEVGDWADVLRQLPRRVRDWMERLQGEGVRGADLVFACIGPALEIFSRYARVESADGREIELGEYLEKVWEVVGRSALAQVLGTAEAKARNGAAGAVEEDARLTALFLWTLQSTNADTPEVLRDESEDEEAADDEEDEEGSSGGKAKGFTLVFDVVRRFAQPLGIELPKWEGRVIETKKGVVRLLPIAERAKQLFGEDGAQAVAARLEQEAAVGTNPLQEMLFPEMQPGAGLAVRGRGRGRAKRASKEVSEENIAAAHQATTLDRVHAAMMLQAAGRTNALRALLKAQQERGPDFLRLANALSALYPKGSEEKRLLDAMLLAVPR